MNELGSEIGSGEAWGLLPLQQIGRVMIAAADSATAAEQVCRLAAEDGVKRHIHLVNAYTISLADTQDPLLNVLNDDDSVCFADGKPLGWVSRFRRQRPLVRQVRGPSLFVDVFDHGRKRNVRHFLLGSTPEVLKSLKTELERRYPGISIAGVESPPFRPLSQHEVADLDARLVASGAQIVWVGLGTPKQDFEAKRIADSTNVTTVAVGAAFDFVAGFKREAPQWISAIGLEWLFRFGQEPRRLWRRYLIGNLVFLRAAFRRRRER